MACVMEGKSNMEMLMVSYPIHVYWHTATALKDEQIMHFIMLYLQINNIYSIEGNKQIPLKGALCDILWKIP